VPTNEDFSNSTFFEEAYAAYLANHTGPLASSGASSALLSLAQIGASATSLTSSTAPPSNPELLAQYALLLEALRSEAVTQELTIIGGISPQFSNDTTKLFSASAKGHFFSILGALEHPFSRGSVHITSNDPNIYPVIDPKYLSHPLDIELLSVIALHLQHVAKTKSLSDLLQGNGTVYQPGYHKLTTENVRDWIRQSVQSEYHPAGTCAMMSRALGGVVGPTFKVYGVKGLRVVDASIFPLLPRGNLQTLVYAVAERAAVWIREGV
jgi:choline dehydrogenase